MNISGTDLIKACSAIGAGLAVIAGIVLVLDKVSQLVTVQQPLDVTQEHRDRLCLLCYLVRPLPRQQVFTAWLSPFCYSLYSH